MSADLAAITARPTTDEQLPAAPADTRALTDRIATAPTTAALNGLVLEVIESRDISLYPLVALRRRALSRQAREAGTVTDDQVCRWYALCTRPAIGTAPHPILGQAPICRRCADKHHLARHITMRPVR